MKKIRVIGVPAAAALAVGLLGSCNGPAPPGPTPTVSVRTDEPTSSPEPTESPSPTVSPDESSTPEPTSGPHRTTAPPQAGAEIWQWALGRDVWSDPDLQRYTRDLGRSWDTDVNVQSLGFQLTPDGSGAVTSVTVYNDENLLGYPGSGSSFSAYPGALPFDLSWEHTATDVHQLLGPGTRAGGWGTDITFTYLTTNDYRVEVGFAARHDADLAGSPIHYIRVSRA